LIIFDEVNRLNVDIWLRRVQRNDIIGVNVQSLIILDETLGFVVIF